MQENNDPVFERLLDHEDFVRRLARGILRSEFEVDDVVQETYIAAWRQKWSSQDNMRGWLGRAARNFSLMRLRAAKRRRRYEQEGPFGSEESSVSDTVALREMSRRLSQGVTTLVEPYREAVHLRFYDGLSYREVGDIQGVTKEAARVRVKRGLETLVRTTGLRGRGPRAPAILAALAFDFARPPVARPYAKPMAAAALVATTALVFVSIARHDAVPGERVHVEASAPPSRDVVPPSASLVASDQDTLDPNRIEGAPLVIRGHVVHAGMPQGNARVRVYRAYDRPESPVAELTAPLAEGVTDASGAFEVEVSRRLRVSVRADVYGMAPTTVLVHAPVAGDPLPAEISVHAPEPTGGRVVRHDGTPLAGATVTARQGWGWVVRSVHVATTTRSGEFVVRGRRPDVEHPMDLTITHPQTGRMVVTSYEPLASADGVLRGLDLPLDSRCSLRGTVTINGEDPAVGFDVEAAVRVAENVVVYGQTVTDKDGNYRIDRLPEGHIYSLTFACKTQPQWIAKPDAAVGITLRADAVAEVRTPLRRGGEITLEAHNQDRTPIAGARLTLYRRTGQERHVVRRAITGPNGQVRLVGLRDGEYGVAAVRGHMARHVRTRLAYPSEFEVDFVIRNGAAPTRHTIVLAPTGAVVVKLDAPHGMYSHGAHPPDQQAIMFFGIESADLLFEGRSSSQCLVGFPRVAVSDDAYAFGPGGDPLVGPFAVRAGETTEVTLRAAPFAKSIRVDVRDEAGRPIYNAAVAMFPPTAEVADFRALTERFHAPAWAVRTDRDGRATLRILQGDLATVQNDWVVAVAHPDAALGWVRGENLATRASVSVTLASGRTIQGEVAGLTHPERAMIHVKRVEDGPRADWRLGTVTDVRGRFHLRHLLPGTYWLSATRNGRHSRDVAVRVGKDTKRVSLRVASGTAHLSGVLLDQDGRTLEGAVVEAESVDTKNVMARTFVDAQGGWRLAVRPGSYRLRTAPSDGVAHFESTLSDPIHSGTSSIRLQVALGVPTTGVIVDPSGRAVTNALVAACPMPGVPLGCDTAPWRLSEADGTFRFPPLHQRFAEFVVVAEGYQLKTQRIRSDRTGHRIVLSQALEVDGYVLDLSGRPARYVEVEILRPGGIPPRHQRKELVANPALDAVETLLEDRLGNLSGQLWSRLGRSVKTDADGRFRFGQLAPGRYAVVARAGPDRTVTAPRWVRAGDGNIELRLARTRSVKGSVDMSQLDPPLSVRDLAFCFVRACANGIEYRRVFVRVDGTYRLESVPAGPIEIRFSSTRSVVADRIELGRHENPYPLILRRPQLSAAARAESSTKAASR